MIECYFDDSGKESAQNEPYVCMAGYMADFSYWTLFFQQWRDLLIKHGISCIHMRDLIPLQGEYKRLGWDPQKRDKVLTDFIRIIKENQLIGFGIGVDANHWHSISEDVRRKYGNAQDFCFQRIMRMVIEKLKATKPEDVVSVTFDTDPEFARVRLNRFFEIWAHDNNAREYLAAITFANPKIYVQLQAADLLAWETRKDLVQKSGGYTSTPRYKDLFTALLDYELEYWSELWDKEELDEKLSRLEDCSKNPVQPA